MTISSGLNFGRLAPRGRGSAAGRKFLASPLQPARSVCVFLGAFFISDCNVDKKTDRIVQHRNRKYRKNKSGTWFAWFTVYGSVWCMVAYVSLPMTLNASKTRPQEPKF